MIRLLDSEHTIHFHPQSFPVAVVVGLLNATRRGCLDGKAQGCKHELQ